MPSYEPGTRLSVATLFLLSPLWVPILLVLALIFWIVDGISWWHTHRVLISQSQALDGGPAERTSKQKPPSSFSN